MRLPISLLSCVVMTFCSNPALVAQTTAPHTFGIADGKFQLDGRPFQVVSGEIHYARVPRQYWRDRLKKARAMGLNTVTTYVFWNLHEPTPGQFDFSGDNDLAEFLKEAGEEGLFVILRPGPYVCAEWELGGYPAWLLKDPHLVLRGPDAAYMAATKRWFERLGREVSPMLVQHGGPVILTQVENEYGSFGSDHAYMEQMRQLVIASKLAAPVLYTADGAVQFQAGAIPGLPAVVNFAPGEEAKSFAALHAFRPAGPFMAGEYWDGWFDHWGEKHQTRDAGVQEAELKTIVSRGDSISLYMFEGGTSFGWMNGANSNGKNYEPDTTSYDYDSALDEAGHPRPKFYVFRDIITAALGTKAPPLPAETPSGAPAVAAVAESASLWDSLPAPVRAERPLTMEDVDQAYGYILYRRTLEPAAAGPLVLDELHDYAQVYLDGRLVATLDRRLGQTTAALPAVTKAARLDILVENFGRVNYTTVLRGERKGITHRVTRNGGELLGWEIYSLPLTDLKKVVYKAGACSGPCFYRTTLDSGHPVDTYLNTEALGKGMVFVEGRPLGRFWSIGPQRSLYLPAPWQRRGSTEIVVFDVNSTTPPRLSTQPAPVW